VRLPASLPAPEKEEAKPETVAALSA
jgi:hypothetical protein